VTWLKQYQIRTERNSSHLTPYLPVLFGAAARTPGAVIVEIGTDIGESTATLLAAAEITGGHMWSVDINPKIGFLDVYARHGDPAGLWTFVCGDSSALTTAKQIPQRIDLLYIDGDHTYEHVCQEIRLYLPRVRGGGMALFHDTHKNTWARPEEFRVDDALNDLLPGMGLHWEDLPGVAGLGVVRVPPDRPCYFCTAQAVELFNPLTEVQQAYAGGSPVEVCAGCLCTAEEMR
jgi:predicted O-methyltransferase YrrM